jgi:hypothetical protein
LAGSTAVNAVVIGMAKAGEVDPVFGAIERERAAYADYLETGAIDQETNHEEAAQEAVGGARSSLANAADLRRRL